MASRLNPYLNFESNAREAMEFYQSVLGGTLGIMTFGQMYPGDEATADLIMHSFLETPDGFTLMGSDTPPGTEFTPPGGVQISLTGNDERLRDYFVGLSAGGTVSMPLEKQVWGDEFGQFVDRFGVGWLVNLSAPQE
ncbi:MAG: VOC family protein [Nocardioidaceae bacterium]